MKITRDTPDMLIAEDIPWGFGIGIVIFILIFAGVGLFLLTEGIIAGLVFLLGGGGLGLGAFWAIVRRVQVILDGASDTLILRRASIFGRSEERHPLGKLQRADIETSTSRDSDGNPSRLQRVALVFDEGRLPLSESYSSGSGHLNVARQVNAWLDARRSPPGLDSHPRSA
ncbi:hypothetical protein [Anianabacter salinae]|uniref:hypothetical protein n=1 Tax=Anianabacter salinae TaxID=2851023 RepID=UPI00225DFC8A|nr:hypothetical protein [Anianabacter salinae]MBV0910966.1 hypothetical protein [Anianabacter salinae]